MKILEFWGGVMGELALRDIRERARVCRYVLLLQLLQAGWCWWWYQILNDPDPQFDRGSYLHGTFTILIWPSVFCFGIGFVYAINTMVASSRRRQFLRRFGVPAPVDSSKAERERVMKRVIVVLEDLRLRSQGRPEASHAPFLWLLRYQYFRSYDLAEWFNLPIGEKDQSHTAERGKYA
jgi:hypothetical protein